VCLCVHFAGKAVPEMINTVLGGMLNPAHSLTSIPALGFIYIYILNLYLLYYIANILVGLLSSAICHLFLALSLLLELSKR